MSDHRTGLSADFCAAVFWFVASGSATGVERMETSAKAGFRGLRLGAVGRRRAAEQWPNHRFYLAALAEKHGLVWATLDGGVKHRASFLIPPTSLEMPSAGEQA